MKQSTKKLLERAIAIHDALESVKPLYKELDEITLELKEQGKVFEHCGRVIVVVDNFLDKNTVFKATGVKRHELKIERE